VTAIALALDGVLTSLEGWALRRGLSFVIVAYLAQRAIARHREAQGRLHS